ncbi:hypothetical protein [Streptomyces sp. NPDC053079]|uniref:hypothetical protein n=1 Tax=Streptomyces sp. NPDC053079 TaxID=3365697 RepID=UPI0037CD4678
MNGTNDVPAGRRPAPHSPSVTDAVLTGRSGKSAENVIVLLQRWSDRRVLAVRKRFAAGALYTNITAPVGEERPCLPS